MKICLFGNSFLPVVGGMEYVIHNLANALVEIGNDVTVVARRVSWSTSTESRAYKLNRFSLPLPGVSKIGLDYCSAIILTTVLNTYRKFDVLNCHGVSYSGARARVIGKISGLPLVLTPHGMDIQKIPEIGYGLRLDPRWDRKITRNLKAADYVTAISQSVHHDLDMIPVECIVDIPNGIHIKALSGPRSSYLHEVLSIPSSTRILLSVGRNHIKKGYDYGIQAVSELVRKLHYDDVHYVIVGRGVSKHQPLLAKCGAEEFVSLMEETPSDKIAQCYKSADIFFSPSIVEGLSLVSIEAMASGLPLVVTNVPGNEDVVKNNGCGIIVKDQDPGDMARGLYELLVNDDLRNRYSQIAISCSSEYDWVQVAKQYEDTYKRAIRNHV